MRRKGGEKNFLVAFEIIGKGKRGLREKKKRASGGVPGEEWKGKRHPYRPA